MPATARRRWWFGVGTFVAVTLLTFGLISLLPLGHSVGNAAFRVALMTGLATPIPLPEMVELTGGKVPDKYRGYRYLPRTLCREYFPENPRGYFDTRKDGFQILAQWKFENDLAEEVDLQGDLPFLRIGSIATRTSKKGAVRLTSRGVSLHAGEKVSLRVRARALPGSPFLQFALLGQDQKPIWPGQEAAKVRLDAKMRDCQIDLPPVPREVTFAPIIPLAGFANGIDIESLDILVDGIPRPEESQRSSFVEYRLNSLGFRFSEVPAAPRPDVLRIACLGDSITFGMGVHERDTFAAQLQHRLETACDVPVEVLNFGMIGYSTFEESALYSQVVTLYRPQMVILTMFWNDHIRIAEEVELGQKSDPSTYYLEVADLAATRSYDECAEEVERLNRKCLKDGARLIVMAFNTEDNVHWRKMVETMQRRLTPLKVPFLELWPAVHAEGITQKQMIAHPSDPHPSDLVHHLAARQLSRVVFTSLAQDAVQMGWPRALAARVGD